MIEKRFFVLFEPDGTIASSGEMPTRMLSGEVLSMEHSIKLARKEINRSWSNGYRIVLIQITESGVTEILNEKSV